jgi:predicted kinase
MPGLVTVLCGPSGFGKSTYATALRNEKTVVSADYYFTNSRGVYAFKPEELPEAHSMCLRTFTTALMYSLPETQIVVDNTNTTLHEMSPYIRLAQAYGRTAEIIAFVSPDPRACAARSVHGVPYTNVVKQYDRMCGMLVDNLGVNFTALLSAAKENKTLRFPVFGCNITLH